MTRQVAVVILLFLVATVAHQPAAGEVSPGTRSPAATPDSSHATAEQLEQQGDAARLDKAYEAAVTAYSEGLRRTEDKHLRSTLLNKRGIVALTLQRFKDAQKDFQRASKLDRSFAQPINNLGVTYYLEKKYGKAVRQYKIALGMQEDNASFHANLATAYFMQKRLPQAMAEYQRALQLNPEILNINSHFGVSAQLGKPEERAAYEYLLAKMYAQAGDFAHSLHYLQHAMEEGYKDINNVYKDAEFSGLRKDARFVDLMNNKTATLHP